MTKLFYQHFDWHMKGKKQKYRLRLHLWCLCVQSCCCAGNTLLPRSAVCIYAWRFLSERHKIWVGLWLIPENTKRTNTTSQKFIFNKIRLRMAWRKNLFYPRHVLHENRQSSFRCVPQAAVVLDYALVKKILQELDLALQRTHLLKTKKNTQHMTHTQDRIPYTYAYMDTHDSGLHTYLLPVNFIFCRHTEIIPELFGITWCKCTFRGKKN